MLLGLPLDQRQRLRPQAGPRAAQPCGPALPLPLHQAPLLVPTLRQVINTLVGHEEESSVEAVAFSRHLPLAASGGLDGKLIVWDVATASARATCEHPDVSSGCSSVSVNC